ncbi:MAG: protein kinase [Gemmatimonadaceae bacterium]
MTLEPLGPDTPHASTSPSEQQRFREVDALFDAALDLPVAERRKFLEHECPDESVRADVAALLDSHERSEGFLASPAAELGAVLLLDPLPSAPERAGPFRIIRELGRGGMGVVYLAERDQSQFSQRVALKLVGHAAAGEIGVRRFLEERRILALLEHPRIARLIDGDILANGQPWFAMELVEGESIDRYCDARRLNVMQRLELFDAVCDAVQYAHEHLVIHRDLKPSNILVAADGQVKLLDFGIAKLVDPLTSDTESQTRTALMALTPDYAAPEQVRGEPVTTATDSYALGVLLYLLLTGHRPYVVAGTSPAEMERIICDVDPPRPSDVVGQGESVAEARGTTREKLVRALRGDLDVIALKALHKDPQRRYSSAATLREDLRRFREGQPVLARPDRAGYRLRKFMRRNRAGVLAGAVATVTLLTATIFSAVQMREAQAQRDAAVRETERQRALRELQTILASDSRDSAGRPLTAIGRLQLAERYVAQRFKATPALQLDMLMQLAGRFAEDGDRGAHRRLMASAKAIALSAHLPAALAYVNCDAATSLLYDDQRDSAKAAVEEGKAALRRAVPADPAAEARCVDAEGQLLSDAGSTDSAIALIRRALVLSERDPDQTRRLEYMKDLAQALRASGRTREATMYQRSIIAELDSTGFTGTDILPNALTYLAGALAELGELAALDSVCGYLLQRQVERGENSSAILAFLYGLGKVRMGELDAAEQWLVRAMRDTTEGAGGLSTYLAPAFTQLRLEQGRPKEARAAYADLPSGTLIRRVNRAWFEAWIRHEEGDQRALGALEDSLRAIGGNGPRLSPSLAMPLVTASGWRLAAGDVEQADSLARLAIETAAVDSVARTRSAYVGFAELILARARARGGDVGAARQAAERAVTAMTNGLGARNARVREALVFRDSLSR